MSKINNLTVSNLDNFFAFSGISLGFNIASLVIFAIVNAMFLGMIYYEKYAPNTQETIMDRLVCTIAKHSVICNMAR